MLYANIVLLFHCLNINKHLTYLSLWNWITF